MEKTEMMIEFEQETGKHSVILKFITGGQALGSKDLPKIGSYEYSTDYIAWLEAKANISDEAIKAFQEIIRNQCDEISALKEKSATYGRLMSGGSKKLKEWANMFGMVVAVDQNGEASCFGHIPVMYLDEGEGIWTNNPKHYGEETYLLPPHLIDFDGDWKDSLTLPDGLEEACDGRVQ